MDNTIFITGAGIISAVGNNKAETKQSLLAKESGIGELHHLQSAHRELPCGEVKMSNEELREMLGMPEGKACNRTALLGIEAIRQALEQSGIAPEEAFLVSGTTVGGMDATERHFLEMLEDDRHLALLASHDSGSTTKLMAEYFGIPNGHTATVSTACSSAANALIVGANMIKTGKAEKVIAGGSESLSLFHLNGFNTLMVLDTERCRPFDATRKGLNLGEGASFVVLESAASVMRRGGKPLAILSGYGNRCDAFHQTASSPDGEGAYLAMKEALDMAGLSPGQIDYVNAHGTGTLNNDSSESAALKRIFGQDMPPVSSTKPFTGHTTSASGSIETTICLLAMQEGFIPANLGWQNQMPDGITPAAGRTGIRLKHIMCNSFGFGGNDSSLVISQAGSHIDAPDIPEPNRTGDTLQTKVLSRNRLTPDSPKGDIRKYMPPLETRRLCDLQKSAMAASLSALQEAHMENPDAIIVGTSYGMLENSEKFLLQMCKEGEQGLSPTLFMQSTHNTIAGSLAIRTHCHGYNITYTDPDEERVLALCRQDAEMLMRQGKIRNALVGYYNEVTPALHDMILRLYGKDVPVGVTAVAEVIEKQ